MKRISMLIYWQVGCQIDRKPIHINSEVLYLSGFNGLKRQKTIASAIAGAGKKHILKAKSLQKCNYVTFKYYINVT
jgi:hypothetical protein